MPSTREILAQRLREARERLKLRQEDLAAVADFNSSQIVSQIELGARDVKAWELAKLAAALHVDIQDLLSPEPITRPVVLWREAPSEGAETTEAQLLERHQRFCFIQRVTGTRPQFARPIVSTAVADMSYAIASDLAEQVRSALDLGDRPALTLAGAMENRYGVLIWYTDLGRNGSAASFADDQGAVVLLNSAESSPRRNFSLAHELFHILTWHPEHIASLQANGVLHEKGEKLANCFASALLLPVSAVNEAMRRHVDGGRLTTPALVAIATHFDVSTQALLWRLKNLGVYRVDQVQQILSDPFLSAMDKTQRVTRWIATAPLPPRFVALCYLAWLQGQISRGRLAEFLEVNLADLEGLLAAYGFSHSADTELPPSIAINTPCLPEEEEWPVNVPAV